MQETIAKKKNCVYRARNFGNFSRVRYLLIPRKGLVDDRSCTGHIREMKKTLHVQYIFQFVLTNPFILPNEVNVSPARPRPSFIFTYADLPRIWGMLLRTHAQWVFSYENLTNVAANNRRRESCHTGHSISRTRSQLVQKSLKVLSSRVVSLRLKPIAYRDNLLSQGNLSIVSFASWQSILLIRQTSRRDTG